MDTKKVKNIPLSRLMEINEIDDCPFCGSEEFKVDDKTGIFKCFSCFEAGDGIYLYQNLFDLDFLEAVEILSALQVSPDLASDPER